MLVYYSYERQLHYVWNVLFAIMHDTAINSTAPTLKGDLIFFKWGPNGDLILSEMGTKWGPSTAEMGTQKTYI